MPKLTPPPSKAGPAGQEAASERVAVADEGFGVRADVQDRRRARRVSRDAGRQQAGRRVGADVAAHERQAVDARLGMDRQAKRRASAARLVVVARPSLSAASVVER